MSDKNNSGLEVVGWLVGDTELESPEFQESKPNRPRNVMHALVRLSDAEAALAAAKKEIAGWVKTYDAEDEFNTSLVAVNAELVEALRTLVDCSEYGPLSPDADAWKYARAALLKAEGASHGL